MRRLSDNEIAELRKYGCTARDWEDIHVTEDFSPSALREVHFEGRCTIGLQDASRGDGISCVTLCNCDIESGVTISDVYEGIRGYRIASGTVIKRVRQLAFNPEEHCGEGFEAFPLDETGSRPILVTDALTAQIAFLLAFARHDDTVAAALYRLCSQYALQATPKEKAFIATGSRIEDCGTLLNLNVKEASIIRDVRRLQRATLRAATLGEGVVAENLVCLRGAVVEEGCTLHNCFVGEASRLSGSFSAHDTLIFANALLSNGEASAAILGPHTVSAHRSTLLIGGCFSFFNAGSGTNQSNHHYRLGPIHYGIAERGCKSASDSYILWPAHIGAYTKITGRILTRPDVAAFPFSALSSRDYGIVLQPGSELATIGIYRDAEKWPRRDKRRISRPVEGLENEACFRDLIAYCFYDPYIVYRLLQGYRALKTIQEKAPQTKRYTLRGALIESEDLLRGLQYYRAALQLYLLEELGEETLRKEDGGRTPLEALLARGDDSLSSSAISSPTVYYDLLGVPVSKNRIETLFELLRSNKICELRELHMYIEKAFVEAISPEASLCRYWEVLWTLYPEAASLNEALLTLLSEANSAVALLYKQPLNDARRELRPRRTTAMGLFANNKEELDNEMNFTRAALAAQPFLERFVQRDRDVDEKIKRLLAQLSGYLER